jgi:hypothetical protein
MGDNDESFFTKLAELTSFDDVISTEHHQQAPETWHVVVTDVAGSTQAIENGYYKDVNAVGVASILALRNALADVELPYVFGGDGATVLVPGSRITSVETALRGIRNVAREVFSLDLRVSLVPVARLLQFGHPFLVGRYRLSQHVVLAAFSGRGVSVAEQWVKDPERGREFAVSDDGPAEADLSGFECRWQPATSRRGKIVSLLVVAMGERAVREDTYRSAHAAIAALTGQERHPLSVRQMKLKPYRGDFSIEARMRSGEAQGSAYQAAERRARRLSLAGRGLLKLGLSAGGFDGSSYMSEFLQNTDFQKFDEALRMVLDMPEGQVSQLARYLQDRFVEGKLAYGMHLSDQALITCMVKSYAGDHVHFVDGAEGGYALAAKQLKAQLKSFSE